MQNINFDGIHRHCVYGRFFILHAIDEVLRDTFRRCLEEIPGVAKNKERVGEKTP